jgi:hypothetical protein
VKTQIRNSIAESEGSIALLIREKGAESSTCWLGIRQRNQKAGGMIVEAQTLRVFQLRLGDGP